MQAPEGVSLKVVPAAAAGERQLRAVHLMFDAGRSINPAVDLGQVGCMLALADSHQGCGVHVGGLTAAQHPCGCTPLAFSCAAALVICSTVPGLR